MSSDSYLEYSAFRYEGEKTSARVDHLLVEQPLAIRINGEPWTLTMQTPGHEVELAAGLAFTEGVIQRQAIDASNFSVSNNNNMTSVDIMVPEAMLQRNEMRKRTLLSLSSCGICGRTELPVITEGRTNGNKFNPAAIPHMIEKMRALQTLFATTGGCHAATAFDNSGEVICSMEDIGRHNAVDKVIGRLLLNNTLHHAKAITVSSRVSYEIIVKCYAAAVPVLIAVSAPSSLAVDMAKEFGMSLYGFCREDRFTQYA